jgi:hypothetical protein
LYSIDHPIPEHELIDEVKRQTVSVAAFFLFRKRLLGFPSPVFDEVTMTSVCLESNCECDLSVVGEVFGFDLLALNLILFEHQEWNNL